MAAGLSSWLYAIFYLLTILKGQIMNNKKLYGYELKKVEVHLGEKVPMKFFAISKATTIAHLLIELNQKLEAYNTLASLLDKKELLQDRSHPIYDVIDESYECFQDNQSNIQ
ncbi:hypothetical protein ACSSV9_14395 [Melioribacter sp. OK-6-Me]|uniref:hypothetical protein n=1 Tax=Melioribacter sp. OK-6-Me TaxID=3423433 RepID=UPI003ED8786F